MLLKLYIPQELELKFELFFAIICCYQIEPVGCNAKQSEHRIGLCVTDIDHEKYLDNFDSVWVFLLGKEM